MALFEKSVDNLLQKPEAHRKRVVWLVSALVMVFIVIIWVLSLRQTALKSQATELQLQNDESEKDQQSLTNLLQEQAQQQELLQQGAVVDDGSTDQLPNNNIRVVPEGSTQSTNDQTGNDPETQQQLKSAIQGLDDLSVTSSTSPTPTPTQN